MKYLDSSVLQLLPEILCIGWVPGYEVSGQFSPSALTWNSLYRLDARLPGIDEVSGQFSPTALTWNSTHTVNEQVYYIDIYFLPNVER